MRRRLIPLLALVALPVAACSSGPSVFDGGTVTTVGPATTGAPTTTAGEETTTTTGVTETTLGGGGQAMADRIAAELLAQEDMGLPIDETAAQCLGSQIVSAIGLPRLEALEAASGSEGDLGAAMELMTPEEQSTVMGVILQGTGGQPACIDLRSFLVDSMVEGGLSATSAECVADAFTQGTLLQDLLMAGLAAQDEDEIDPAIMTQFFTVMMSCLSPEELAEMGEMDLGF
jgi:hypothetical protein